jgi:adenylate cyclase
LATIRLSAPKINLFAAAGRIGARTAAYTTLRLRAGEIMFTLVYTHEGRSHRHRLKEGDTIVGRAPGCDLVLEDPSVSRRHACLHVDDGRCTLTDLGGRKTTIVNQRQIIETDLKDGDVLELGGCVLRVDRSDEDRVVLTDDHLIIDSPRTVYRRVDEVGPAAPGAAAVVEPQRLISLLSEISRRLVQWQPLADILDQVIALVFDTIPAERAFLLLLDRATGEIVPRVQRSRNGDLERTTLSRTIIRRAVDERMATLATDVHREPHLAAVGSIHAAGIRSFMCAPLWNQNEVIGVLYVDNPHRAEFSSGDLDVLQALSSYAAVAIEQARLRTRLVEEMRCRERLERYHSASVVDRILSQGGGADAPFLAEERDVTVLFADIVGFTAMSETLTPSEVASLLNRCFAEMCEAVFQQEGTLDKFIGDAVLAIFGAPLPQADHALRGVRAAAAMRRAVASLDCQPPIVLRIALNSGIATVGDIGSPKRREYTALGDVVNTCARLVSSACAPGQIVLGGSTREQVGGAVSLRPLGPATIRGRQGTVELFELPDDAFD